MREIEAVLFDFDGTFAPDTNRLHYISFRKAFEDAGYELREEDLADYFGVPQERLIRTLLIKKFGLGGDPERVASKVNRSKRREYRRLIEDMELPDESVETAEELKERGFHVAIASGSRTDLIESLLPPHLMENVIAAEETHEPKPNPEILLRTARDLGVRPENCIYVGDSWRDHGAADRAQMVFVGVKADITWPGLLESEPEMLIGELPELLEFLEEAPQELSLEPGDFTPPDMGEE